MYAYGFTLTLISSLFSTSNVDNFTKSLSCFSKHLVLARCEFNLSSNKTSTYLSSNVCRSLSLLSSNNFDIISYVTKLPTNYLNDKKRLALIYFFNPLSHLLIQIFICLFFLNNSKVLKITNKY